MTSLADKGRQGADSARPALGQLLVNDGLLSPEDLAIALERQAATGLPLGRILVDDGYVHSSAVAMALADQHGGLLKTEYGFATGRGPARSAPARSAPAPIQRTPPEPVAREREEPQFPLLRLSTDQPKPTVVEIRADVAVEDLRLAPPAAEPEPPALAPDATTLAELRVQLEASEARRRAAELAVNNALERLAEMQEHVVELEEWVARPRKRSWWSR